MSSRNETITYYKCDRCRKEVDHNPFSAGKMGWTKILYNDQPLNYDWTESTFLSEYDLCGECTVKLIEYLQNK